MVRTVPTDRADSLAAIIADFCNKQPNPSHSRQIRESPCHDPNEPTCVAIMPQLFRSLHIIVDQAWSAPPPATCCERHKVSRTGSPRPLSGGAKRTSVSDDAYDRGPMESVALDIGCLPNLAFKRVPAAGSRNECGIALSQFVITQPAVIFFSAAYFAAASLTMGAIMESSAAIQPDTM